MVNLGDFSTYALDRIIGFVKIRKGYRENTLIDPASYFYDVVGVSIPQDSTKQEIIFSAVPAQAPYIKTKPIHSSQRILKDSENVTEFAINVIPNFELEQLFLSFGESVLILSPDYFKVRLAERVKASYNNYFN